jgi:hypothetical protein
MKMVLEKVTPSGAAEFIYACYYNDTEIVIFSINIYTSF